MFTVPAQRTVLIEAVLPAAAITTCYALLARFPGKFSTASRTHCDDFGVRNALPSVSAVVSLDPYKYIWRVSVAISVFLGIANGWLHYAWAAHQKSKWWARCRLAAHGLEKTGLLLLTMISSEEWMMGHTISFALFASAALANVALSAIVVYPASSPLWSTGHEACRRYLCFRRLAGAQLTLLLVACFVYFAHNTACYRNVYSLFALLELGFVMCNILTHLCINGVVADALLVSLCAYRL